MKLRLSAAVATALAVALLAACGGGGGDSSSDFVSQAEKICSEPSAKLTAAEQQQLIAEVQANPDSATQIYVEKSLRPLRETAAKIGALTPPPGEQKALDDFVAAVNSATDQLQKDPDKLITLAAQGQNPFPELEPLVAKLQLQKCFPSQQPQAGG
jgi:hypothetical protein